MKEDNIEELFKTLKNDFDVEEPSTYHEQRFLDKLKNGSGQYTVIEHRQRRRLWKPIIAVAASILLIIAVAINLPKQEEPRDLASISPEMAKTQNFFTSAISEELSKLDNMSSPETEALIADAMKRLNNLEKEYQNLKKDLDASGDDKRVIYAMISNFQTRITILQNTLQEIENIKTIKNSII